MLAAFVKQGPIRKKSSCCTILLMNGYYYNFTVLMSKGSQFESQGEKRGLLFNGWLHYAHFLLHELLTKPIIHFSVLLIQILQPQMVYKETVYLC